MIKSLLREYMKLNVALGFELAKLAEYDSRIYVLDGDLADSDGAHEFAKRHIDRFLEVGIAEQAMVSIAAGMAAMDTRPWVFSFAAFLCFRAYDQIRVGISQTNLPVVLVGSHAGGCLGRNGKTHQALNDIAVMSSLPGIDIWSPGDKTDVCIAISEVSQTGRATYMRLPRTECLPIPGSGNLYRWVTEPAADVIVSCGLGSQWALEALYILKDKGSSIAMVHLNQIWPVPVGLINSLSECKRVWVIEDHYKNNGLALLLSIALRRVEIISIGWPCQWTGASGSDAELRKANGLSTEVIVERIYECI